MGEMIVSNHPFHLILLQCEFSWLIEIFFHSKLYFIHTVCEVIFIRMGTVFIVSQIAQIDSKFFHM